MALKESRDGAGWQQWPADLMHRKPQALQAARRELADAVGEHQFRQFLFRRQLRAVKTFVGERGLHLIGDIPIFVAADSADVWAHPELFLLDRELKPTVVSGVPPDYFAKTGQLWGNPHYDWEAMKRTDYAWWLGRLRATLEQVDVIRLDHFLGFDKAWHVRAGSATARTWRVRAGSGSRLFRVGPAPLGGLPFIAEDLGLVTPEVEKLRDDFDMPGMLILQFAFGGATENRFLPHNYTRNAVVYTGTHDNDTTRGWYTTISDGERDHMRRYTGRDGSDVSWSPAPAGMGFGGQCRDGDAAGRSRPRHRGEDEFPRQGERQLDVALPLGRPDGNDGEPPARHNRPVRPRHTAFLTWRQIPTCRFKARQKRLSGSLRLESARTPKVSRGYRRFDKPVADRGSDGCGSAGKSGFSSARRQPRVERKPQGRPRPISDRRPLPVFWPRCSLAAKPG